MGEFFDEMPGMVKMLFTVLGLYFVYKIVSYFMDGESDATDLARDVLNGVDSSLGTLFGPFENVNRSCSKCKRELQQEEVTSYLSSLAEGDLSQEDIDKETAEINELIKNKNYDKIEEKYPDFIHQNKCKSSVFDSFSSFGKCAGGWLPLLGFFAIIGTVVTMYRGFTGKRTVIDSTMDMMKRTSGISNSEAKRIATKVKKDFVAEFRLEYEKYKTEIEQIKFTKDPAVREELTKATKQRIREDVAVRFIESVKKNMPSYNNMESEKKRAFADYVRETYVDIVLYDTPGYTDIEKKISAAEGADPGFLKRMSHRIRNIV